MKMQVVGLERTSFKPKDEEARVSFIRVHIAREKEGVEGMSVSTFNTSDDKMKQFGQLVPGMHIDAEYNEYGKVGEYKILKSA